MSRMLCSDWPILWNVPVVLESYWNHLCTLIVLINLWCVILINGGMFVSEPSVREESWHWVDISPLQWQLLHYVALVWWWFFFLCVSCVACDPACCMHVVCPLPSTTEDVSCEFGSSKYYALCGFGGILSCGLTHTAVVPLDLVKCRLQVCMEAEPHDSKAAPPSPQTSSGPGVLWIGS